ncbi:hypothetical protein EVAR_442_1 [Eumeta japonica]|uniref:Uncharacterized protein n=1 Tax=Eumeta variegata TaxID=151549 RepID=A0A4C1SAF6_EUMVA|nr:hypothetical protein EVAR_442_1 [Eumeta japonica]
MVMSHFLPTPHLGSLFAHNPRRRVTRARDVVWADASLFIGLFLYVGLQTVIYTRIVSTKRSIQCLQGSAAATGHQPQDSTGQSFAVVNCKRLVRLRSFLLASVRSSRAQRAKYRPAVLSVVT